MCNYCGEEHIETYGCLPAMWRRLEAKPASTDLWPPEFYRFHLGRPCFICTSVYVCNHREPELAMHMLQSLLRICSLESAA